MRSNSDGRRVDRKCKRCDTVFSARVRDIMRGYGYYCSRRCSKLDRGTKIDTKGYPTISAGPCRDIRIATLVAEALIGRTLKPDEQAHHVDGDKLNPRFSNLVVIDAVTHGFVSSKQKWFVENRVYAHEKYQWEDALKEIQERERQQGSDFEFGNNAPAQGDSSDLSVDSGRVGDRPEDD